ncbi:C-C motif chemokine 3-like [Trichosurus vulpecula]|uniref:C-C motif chemokine 3-like n=1 Tax=Trichosurus vulpecula TaxID=9337 RepID=UPI00186B3910|nr:C-C motif chemokine 3-like [Trichosurus vulpecula]
MSCQNKSPGSSGNAPESALLPPPRTMVSLAFLSILIISITGFSFETKEFARYDIPNACCHFYAHRRIPYSLVVDFYETSSLCHKPGIIFLTHKGHELYHYTYNTPNAYCFSWAHYKIPNMVNFYETSSLC